MSSNRRQTGVGNWSPSMHSYTFFNIFSNILGFLIVFLVPDPISTLGLENNVPSLHGLRCTSCPARQSQQGRGGFEPFGGF